jgi:hypothetical protein
MYKILFFTTFFVLTILAIGCGGPAAPNVNSNTPVNANRNTGNAVVINPTPKPVEATTNDAPTLGPVVRAYYEALKKKDDAALRDLLSKGLLKVTEERMKEEKKTGLAAYMAETDRPGNIEIRNEKIDGDRGSAQLKGGTYVNWSSIGFVKEDGKWKMSNESAEIQGVKPSASTPNTGK